MDNNRHNMGRRQPNLTSNYSDDHANPTQHSRGTLHRRISLSALRANANSHTFIHIIFSAQFIQGIQVDCSRTPQHGPANTFPSLKSPAYCPPNVDGELEPTPIAREIDIGIFAYVRTQQSSGVAEDAMSDLYA